jgi:polyhydroxybutyrate depolymerase
MRSKSTLLACVLAIWVIAAVVLDPIGHVASANRVVFVGPPSNESVFNGAMPDVGLTTHAVMSGGVERVYSSYVPESRTDQPYPVVVDIHGTGSNPEEELEVSGMARAAEERGFVVILPIARIPRPNGGARWNIPFDEREADDVLYIADLLDDASRRLDLDSRRVFVTGFSGGARLASEVASRLSNRIAALGAVGGLRAPSGPGRPVPVIAFHGTGDPVNPYEGEGPVYWRYGLKEAFERWADRNRCEGLDDTLQVVDGVQCVRSAGCSATSDLQLYVLDGVGHVWPGSQFAFPPERFGRMTGAVDATSLMLDFFARHPFPEVERISERSDRRTWTRSTRVRQTVLDPRPYRKPVDIAGLAVSRARVLA